MTPVTTFRFPGLAATLALALALTACSRAPTTETAAAAPRPGSVQPLHGPPLHSMASTEAAACTQADTHTVHAQKFGCSTCHPTGATYGFDVPHLFPKGTTTAGGTIVLKTPTTPTSCSVACHYPSGAAPRAVTWNTPGPLACTACHDTSLLPASHPSVLANATRADCQGCHTMTSHLSGTVVAAGHAPSWVDQASAGFHAYSANEGLAGCQSCHGVALDGVGGTARTSCASCHDVGLPTGVASWKVNCVMCHGGTNDQTGAPPRTTWGNTEDAVRVGAHATHVNSGTAIAPAFDCAVCHVRPGDALTAGHLAPGAAQVVFAGVAAQGSAPTWTRASATCASTYCHGATLAGGSNTSPVWTSVGTGQAACGSCHGLPPPSPHPAVSGLTGCAGCHPATMDAAGSVIPPSAGGLHLDGIVEVSGGGHPSTWLDRTSPGFHAFSANLGLGACQSCHGANLDGVGGSATTACATCHGPTWRTNCVMCHGGTNDQTGAPPRTTWGNSADAVRVGAHEKHVKAGAIAGAVACSVCHPTPTDALSPGHVSSATATVTFGGVAASSGATPSWSRATTTCGTTYCHGGYDTTYTYFFYDAEYTAPVIGARGNPTWTSGPMSCTSCHGLPPQTGNWHSPSHPVHDCNGCHPDVNAAGTAITRPALHVNGIIEVQATYRSSCFSCH